MSDTPPPDPSDDGTTSSTGLLAISETVDLCNIVYSREETIAAFKGYYEFLTKMYMDPEHVILPPAGGWPDITLESMRGLGKTEEVVELLRHLPYVRKLFGGDDEIHAAGVCQFADWTYHARALANPPQPPQTPINMADYVLRVTQGAWDHIPPHVIGLVDSKDFQIFLDTGLGVIYFSGGVFCPGPVAFAGRSDVPLKPISDDPYDYAPEEEAEWRSASGAGSCGWSIFAFFEMLKFHFRELHYIPMTKRFVEEDFQNHEAKVDEVSEAIELVQGIFRQHGWPNLEQYQKARCLQDVKEQMGVLQQKSPDLYFGSFD